jgi:1-phosphofructokinase family hexose kinase
MILTVTPDPVLDNVLLVDEWTQGLPMTAVDQHYSVGGKGLDSSVALSHLAVETTALCFLAGRTGRDLEDLIKEKYGFPLHPIWIPGQTRTAHIVSEVRHKTHSHIFTGGILPVRQDEQVLLAKIDDHINQASFVITGGVLPTQASQDLHAQIIDRAQAANTPTLIDAHTKFMTPALACKPTIVKLNQHEFCATFDKNCSSIPELIYAGRAVHANLTTSSLIITCGPDGILAFTHQGNFHARPPRLSAVNAAGAGDAASAALAWQLSQTSDWPHALRWAAAVSAAVVLTPGTADCRQEDIDRLLPQITVEAIS